MIEDSAITERFGELRRLSEPLDEIKEPRFSFLTPSERSAIEDAIAEGQLVANESSGMCFLGHYIQLCAPYDKRATRFVDLSRCRTSDR